MTTLTSSTAVPVAVPIEFSEPTATDAELRARTNSSRSPLDKIETGLTVDESNNAPLEVIGSTNIYDNEGKIRLIPVGPSFLDWMRGC